MLLNNIHNIYCSLLPKCSLIFKSLPGAESLIGEWHVETNIFPPALCSLAVEEACKYVHTSIHY